ncbi:MAG: dTDP-glucose 4,6-dehydratase [Sphingobacteriia bacterium]|nr:dTDP-glucose 4,6-dehydratase [Sphingobacteriia bacterium]
MQISNLLVTGGLGFIGSNFVNLFSDKYNIIILDKYTYAANEKNIIPKNVKIIKGDIGDIPLVTKLLEENNIQAIVNFAAESHVDNSINSPKEFINTNIVGTYNLLNSALDYFKNFNKSEFRFLHVSTDEVFGSLNLDEEAFTENSQYKPNSPYSASKAASDHLVRAWFHTYGLPTIITNCSNNYGPNQHTEKLIPNMIKCALSNKPLPVYGNGKNIRDWIFVNDHCHGINLALTKGRIGETYCFGGEAEKQNLEVVNAICEALDSIKPKTDGKSYKSQISFVTDRPGHDFRYAINNSKAYNELGYKLQYNFSQGLEFTVKWYLSNI